MSDKFYCLTDINSFKYIMGIKYPTLSKKLSSLL